MHLRVKRNALQEKRIKVLKVHFSSLKMRCTLIWGASSHWPNYIMNNLPAYVNLLFVKIFFSYYRQ